MFVRKAKVLGAAACVLAAAGCNWNPFVRGTPPPTTVSVVNPLRTAEIEKPSLYDTATFNLSTKPCDCPEGYVTLSTGAYWTFDEPTDEFSFQVYQPAHREGLFRKSRPTEVLSPRDHTEENRFELLPGVYDVAVRPQMGSRMNDNVIWVRGLNLTQPGMEYDLSMELHGALVRIENVDRYRVYSGGTKARYLDGGTVEALPVSRLYTQSGRRFEFPVPAGSYDIYLIREGQPPVWIENYRPQPGQVNVIDAGSLPPGLNTERGRTGTEAGGNKNERGSATEDEDGGNWSRYGDREKKSQ